MDSHWYLDIIFVLGNCGGLKGLVDKVVADLREFTVYRIRMILCIMYSKYVGYMFVLMYVPTYVFAMCVCMYIRTYKYVRGSVWLCDTVG